MRTRYTVILDAAAVVLFVAIGRASHDEAASVVGFLGTLWPFAVGLAAGPLLHRHDRDRLPAGLLTWLATVAGGMVLRALSGQGVAASFVAVAAVFLALTLLGWRLAVAVGRRRRLRPARS